MSDPTKTQWRNMPWKQIKKLAEVIDRGDKDHEPMDWVDKPKELFIDALFRHLCARFSGEKNDPKDGLDHLAHAAVNCLYIMEIEERGEKKCVRTSISEEDIPIAWRFK